MKSETIHVLRPDMRHEIGWVRCWIEMLRNSWERRGLILQLVRRDLVGKYKKSWIGLGWIVIMPLLGVVSWVFLQQAGVLKPGDVGIPYPAFVLLGTSFYGLFRQLCIAGSTTLQSAQAFIQHVTFPHEALLFRQVGTQLVDLVVTLVLNLIVLTCFGIIPAWQAIFLPAAVLPLLLLAAAIGMTFSMVAVVVTDMTQALQMVLGIGMYFTPIIYSDSVQNSILQSVISWNPLTYLICSCRDLLLYGRLYDPVGYCWSSLFAVICFFVAWRVYFVSEGRIIERMI